jgi:hypothetical protein
MCVYLFATVPGSLSLELGFLSEHPVLSGVVVIGGVVLLVLVGRYVWHRATKLRDELKSGGAILGQPRRFIGGVALPAVGSFAARLGIVAVFLAAFSISVTSTRWSRSRAGTRSPTTCRSPRERGGHPGAERRRARERDERQQRGRVLGRAAADVVFAVVLGSWVFSWSGDKQLVRESYAASEVKERELKERRQARRVERGRRLRISR